MGNIKRAQSSEKVVAKVQVILMKALVKQLVLGSESARQHILLALRADN